MKKTAFYLLVALATGTAIGAWGMRFYFSRTLAGWDPRQQLVLQLSGELELDGDQQMRLGEILEDHKKQADVLRESRDREVAMLGRGIQDQLMMELRPEQVRRLQNVNDSIHGRLLRFLWMEKHASSVLAINSGQ